MVPVSHPRKLRLREADCLAQMTQLLSNGAQIPTQPSLTPEPELLFTTAVDLVCVPPGESIWKPTLQGDGAGGGAFGK